LRIFNNLGWLAGNWTPFNVARR